MLSGLLVAGSPALAGSIYWITALVCLGLAALLGGIFHIYPVPGLFRLIYLILAALLAGLSLATLADVFGEAIAFQYRWPVAVVALVFFLVTWLYPTRILAFAAFEVVVLVVIFLAYGYLMAVKGLAGAATIAGGVAVTLAGAFLYLKNVGLKLIWEFDHKGVYHLVQIVAVYLFYLGLSQR